MNKIWYNAMRIYHANMDRILEDENMLAKKTRRTSAKPIANQIVLGNDVRQELRERRVGRYVGSCDRGRGLYVTLLYILMNRRMPVGFLAFGSTFLG